MSKFQFIDEIGTDGHIDSTGSEDCATLLSHKVIISTSVVGVVGAAYRFTCAETLDNITGICERTYFDKKILFKHLLVNEL